jgi:sugar diacid utilization regulator
MNDSENVDPPTTASVALATSPRDDLGEVANIIATAVGGAVAIFVGVNNLVAHSTGDHPIDGARRDVLLNRRLRPEMISRYKRDAVWELEKKGVIVIEPSDEDREAYPDMRRRMDSAVRAGREVVGTVSVVEGERPFDQRTEQELVRLAQYATPYVLAADAHQRREQQWMARQVDAVLFDHADATDAWELLRLAPSSGHAIMALRPYSDVPGVELAAKRERLIDQLSFSASETDHRCPCTHRNGTFYLVVSGDIAHTRARLHRVASQTIGRVDRLLEVRLRGCLGAPADGWRQLRASRSVVDRALDVLTDHKVEVIDAEEHRLDLVLADISQFVAASRGVERSDLVRQVRAHDAEHGTEYFRTLATYYEEFGDTRRAATALGVHANTVRYRVTRAQELFGESVRNAADWFLITLAARLDATTHDRSASE